MEQTRLHSSSRPCWNADNTARGGVDKRADGFALFCLVNNVLGTNDVDLMVNVRAKAVDWGDAVDHDLRLC